MRYDRLYDMRYQQESEGKAGVLDQNGREVDMAMKHQ